MIQFEPLMSLTWAWLFALAVCIILAIQIYWILTHELKSSTKAIRISLNTLFGIILIGYIFQPVWSTDSSKEAVLVYSKSVSRDKIRFWKDSLDIRKSLEIRNYKREGNPVYLLGSEFSEAELLKMNGKDIHWISDAEAGSISYLEWKGLLRAGEMQEVKGKIITKDTVRISIVQEGEMLAETNTNPNLGTFKLEFPARVLGRNQLELLANDSLLGYLNFFTQAAKPIQYSLKFSFPDAEIRMLSQYLINAGEQVNEEIDVSRNSTIQSGNSDADSLQFLIIDPEQLGKKSTQDAIAQGASILLINISEVNSDIQSINKTLETSFSTKRSTTNEQRVINDDLDAQPFEFEEATAQKLLFENAFAVQQVGNAKVGVSLLGKTYPIKLAGDSIRYNAIWEKLLGAMIPQESGSLNISQPTFKGMKTVIQANQATFDQEFIKIDSDSVFLQQSLVNPFTKTASFTNLDSGWVTISDSLEFYSYLKDEWKSIQSAKLRAEFLAAHDKIDKISIGSPPKTKITDWVWYGMFLAILTLIWLEPKVSNRF